MAVINGVYIHDHWIAASTPRRIPPDQFAELGIEGDPVEGYGVTPLPEPEPIASPENVRRGRKPLIRTARTCDSCGRRYFGYMGAKYCGEECRKQGRIRAHALIVGGWICRECGEGFVPRMRDKPNVHCSNECRAASRARKKQERRSEDQEGRQTRR